MPWQATGTTGRTYAGEEPAYGNAIETCAAQEPPYKTQSQRISRTVGKCPLLPRVRHSRDAGTYKHRQDLGTAFMAWSELLAHVKEDFNLRAPLFA